MSVLDLGINADTAYILYLMSKQMAGSDETSFELKVKDGTFLVTVFNEKQSLTVEYGDVAWHFYSKVVVEDVTIFPETNVIIGKPQWEVFAGDIGLKLRHLI